MVLVRMIREGCAKPDGTKPTMQQVADLLGMADSALYGWAKPPKSPRRPSPVLPFPVLFALRVLVANMSQTSRAIWAASQ